jgi:glycosyltransferase involved in cell wall biosynthesis
MEKIPLSVVIVTKNEEKVIGRCIDSIKDIADEILVIDSGSEDKTVEIAEEKGARVIKRKWPGYPKQVQYGIDTAKNDFVLVLDADEEVSKDLKISIIENVKNPLDFSCFSLKRKTFYLGKFLEHTWYPEWRIRLFKKDKVRYEGYLHETVLCDGKIGNLSGDLYHYSFKSLKHQFLKAIEYADTASKELFEKGKKASFKHLLLNPLWSFIKNFIINRGFLDGKRGFIASVYMSFYTFMKYAFLYEKSLRSKYGNDLWKR